MFDELKTIKSGKKELREFGLTIGIILVILGAVALWRGKEIYPYFLTIGALFIILGLMLPGILKPLQKIWMGFSVIVGFFMSRLILCILFYVAITPIGLIMRLFGKDLLEQKIDKARDSYWCAIDTGLKTKESYENQY